MILPTFLTIPVLAWQNALATTPYGALEDAAAAVAITSALAAVAFRIGVWHAQVHGMKQSLTASIAAFRDEMHQAFAAIDARFAAIERRLATLEQTIAASANQRAIDERWKGGIDEKLAAIAQRVAHLEEAPAPAPAFVAAEVAA